MWMNKRRIFLNIVLSHVLAGIGSMLYLQWPNYDGHADVPLSAFPFSLVWAPLAPYIAVANFSAGPRESVMALVVFVVVFSISMKLFSEGREKR